MGQIVPIKLKNRFSIKKIFLLEKRDILEQVQLGVLGVQSEKDLGKRKCLLFVTVRVGVRGVSEGATALQGASIGVGDRYIVAATVAKGMASDIDVNRWDFRRLGLRMTDGVWLTFMKGVNGKAVRGLGAVDVCFVIVLDNLRVIKRQII